ncbi:class I SAM-dependent methyltransferase [Sphingomonas sp. YL-JM2C]
MLEDLPTAELAAYVRKWDGHLSRYFGPRMDPAGKRILVIGSQFGPEILWALKRGAAHVVGVDPAPARTDALQAALVEAGLGDRLDAFEMISGTTHTLGEMGGFDYVMSNNVFEHIHDLAHTLMSLRRFVPARGNRIVIFADPLFYSSAGHHLRAGPWDHLTRSAAELEPTVPPRQWEAYRTQLNGMTITDFLGAVRDSGMILLDLGIVADRALDRFAELRPLISPGLKPMDLCCEGIACTLAFPENI